MFEGEHAPTPAVIEFESIPSDFQLIYNEKPRTVNKSSYSFDYQRQLSEEDKQKALNEVELQQTEFGEKNQ